MAAETLTAELAYSWVPLHLMAPILHLRSTVAPDSNPRAAAHWGPAVYKWEGRISSGPNVGKVGILNGETKDLRQRIKQYISGTQERGNRICREGFLTRATSGCISLIFIASQLWRAAKSAESQRLS